MFIYCSVHFTHTLRMGSVAGAHAWRLNVCGIMGYHNQLLIYTYIYISICGIGIYRLVSVSIWQGMESLLYIYT